MTFGELLCAAIMALKGAGRIVCVRINGGPSVSVYACEGSKLTWCEYSDHPTEKDELFSVDLDRIHKIQIEDAGQHPYAPATPAAASEPQDAIRAAELRGKRAAMDAVHAALLALSQEIEAGG